MTKQEKDFFKVYGDYYRNQISDEDLTETATQPYWQSMKLSKEHLKHNDLKMDINISKIPSIPVKTMSYTGKKETVTHSVYHVFVNKVLKKDDKIILKQSKKQLAIVDKIKFNVTGDSAACPNCGNIGKISSYIDGCDYCGSKFDVKEFDDKVSSFIIKDDNASKIKHFVKTIAIGLSIFSVLAIVGFIISLLLLYFNTTDSGQLSTALKLTIAFMGLFLMIPSTVKIILFSLIVLAVAGFIIYRLHNKRVISNDALLKIKSEISGFSPDDFAQELEYKLRDIHFADTKANAGIYSSMDMSDVLDSYKNVIDCELTKLEFTGIEKKNDNYFIHAKAVMSVTKLYNDKPKCIEEHIYLTLSAKKSAAAAKISSIRHFTCASCGASINPLDGCVCEYCGQKVNYSDYSWVIDRYVSGVSPKKTKQHNLQGTCRLSLSYAIIYENQVATYCNIPYCRICWSAHNIQLQQKYIQYYPAFR